MFIPAGSIEQNNRRFAADGHIDNKAAADAELGQCFQDQLEKISRPCEWGDHLELAAFAKAYEVDVTVWHNDYKTSQPAEDGKSAKRHFHLAFDALCSHWSSIRKVTGLPTGLPVINYSEEVKVDLSIVAKFLEDNAPDESFGHSVSGSSSSPSASSRNKRRRDSGGDCEGRPRRTKRRHCKLAN